MEYLTAEKDVGVTIDNKLSFEQHISDKLNKANSIVGLIRRTFKYLSMTIFRICKPLWNPYLKKHIDMIENVQRRATKMVPGLADLT
jgi:hypothetical protein